MPLKIKSNAYFVKLRTKELSSYKDRVRGSEIKY